MSKRTLFRINEQQLAKKRSITWNYERTFINRNDAEYFVKSETCWSFKNTNNTESGVEDNSVQLVSN